jgi:hypothetical protein
VESAPGRAGEAVRTSPSMPERPEAAVGADFAGWGRASVMDFRATVSGIRMQARQYVGNTEERKHHDCETQNTENMRLCAQMLRLPEFSSIRFRLTVRAPLSRRANLGSRHRAGTSACAFVSFATNPTSYLREL